MISTLHLNKNMPPSPLKRSFDDYMYLDSMDLDLDTTLQVMDDLTFNNQSAASITGDLDLIPPLPLDSLASDLAMDLKLEWNSEVLLPFAQATCTLSSAQDSATQALKDGLAPDKAPPDHAQDSVDSDISASVVTHVDPTEPPKKKQKLPIDGKDQAQVIDPTVQVAPAAKTAGSMNPQSLLHGLCQAFPTKKDIINTAIMLDESAVRRPAELPLFVGSEITTGSNGRLWSFKKIKTPLQDFQFPVNIAINNQASCEVVQVLANAAPEVLLKPEAPTGLTTLQIALQRQSKNDKLVRALLQANPSIIHVLTKHKDTPLHMACHLGCPLSVVEQIYKANPAALKKTNFHGQTPLKLAQHTLICPDDVLNYLQAQSSFIRRRKL